MTMGFYLACLLLKARRLADTPLLLLLALAPPLISTLYLLPEGTRRFVMLFSLQRCDLNMVADVCKWQAEEEDTRAPKGDGRRPQAARILRRRTRGGRGLA